MARPRGTKPETIDMANTSSAKKAARKIERRTKVNMARRSRVRTFVRKVEEAIAAGDKTAAVAALKAAEPELMRAVSKGVVHKNTGSRKVSRLSKRVTAMA
jgi:small subunit ribosomal protein S20